MKYIVTLLLAASLIACTENSRAKNWGGSTTVSLPKDTKFVAATWKEAELWYIYRPSREGETPETVIMKEQSSFGVMQGEVKFQEQ